MMNDDAIVMMRIFSCALRARLYTDLEHLDIGH